MRKITKIKVEKLRLRAYIGFNGWEKEKLQDVVISYSFKYDANSAVLNDDENLAIDYKKITKHIIQNVDNKRFNLLETLAESVWQIIKRNHKIIDLYVKVEKPNALRFCDNVFAEISDNDRSNKVVISIGSNISPDENIKKAINKISEIGNIIRKTNIIKTKPLKYTNQDDFLNCAVLLETSFGYDDVQIKLKEIEHQLKRIRTNNKSGPRTIDLDIVVFNNTITDDDFEEFGFLKDFANELLDNTELYT